MTVPFENRYYGEEIAASVVPREGAAPPSEEDLKEPKRLELKARLAPDLKPYRDIQFKERS